MRATVASFAHVLTQACDLLSPSLVKHGVYLDRLAQPSRLLQLPANTRSRIIRSSDISDAGHVEPFPGGGILYFYTRGFKHEGFYPGVSKVGIPMASTLFANGYHNTMIMGGQVHTDPAIGALAYFLPSPLKATARVPALQDRLLYSGTITEANHNVLISINHQPASHAVPVASQAARVLRNQRLVALSDIRAVNPSKGLVLVEGEVVLQKGDEVHLFGPNDEAAGDGSGMVDPSDFRVQVVGEDDEHLAVEDSRDQSSVAMVRLPCVVDGGLVSSVGATVTLEGLIVP